MNLHCTFSIISQFTLDWPQQKSVDPDQTSSAHRGAVCTFAIPSAAKVDIKFWVNTAIFILGVQNSLNIEPCHEKTCLGLTARSDTNRAVNFRYRK